MSSQVQSPRSIAVRLAAAVGVPLSLLHELRELHAGQWELENVTRQPVASADQIATAKGEIDASNARRHQLIDAIDAAAIYTPPGCAARYYSETIGELSDRLLIFDLKLAALERLEQSTAQDALAVRSIEQVCGHLSVTATQLIRDIAAGHAAIPPRAGVKVYDIQPNLLLKG